MPRSQVSLPSSRFPSRSRSLSRFIGAGLNAMVTLAFLPGCQRSPSPPSPPRDASSPASTQPSSPLEASGPVKEAALVRDLRLGLDDLRKEIAEKSVVERKREKAADVLLQSRVTTRLWDDPAVPAGAIAVSVKDGHVTLEGRVSTVEQVQRALLAALMVSEVAGATSKLALEPDEGKGSTGTPK